MRPPRTWHAMGALLAGLSSAILACGPVTGNAGEQTSSPLLATSPTLQSSLGTGPELLDLMTLAPTTTAYRGRRRLQLAYEGGTSTLEYLEEVCSDGAGSFAIQTLSVLSQLDDPEVFRMLQDLRQGFTYRFRDFQVRNRRLFEANYSLELLSVNAPMAGVPCYEMRVERLRAPETYYRVHVDQISGLVLRWEHRTLAGELLGSMEFETFERDPILTHLELQNELFVKEQLDLFGAPEEQLGFVLRLPNLPPTGFELETADSMQDGNGSTWARLVYSDGVERVALLHGAPAYELERDEVPSDQALLFELGAWTALYANLDETLFIVMGKVPEADLFLMLESAR